MKFDVIIIGGGIIGCCCAGYLSRAGKRVALLERGQIAQGTTSNSFSWANASSKTSNEAYHRLNAMGVDAYKALAQEFSAAMIGVNAVGALFLADESDAPGMKDLLARQERLNTFGYGAEMLSNAILRQIEPGLNLGAGMTGLRVPRDMTIDGPKLSRFMVSFVENAGGMVRENCGLLELLADDNGTITGVQMQHEALGAPKVIVAAGQHTGEALSKLTGYDGFEARFPLQKVPGLLLTTPPVDPSMRPRHVVCMSPSQEVHFLPEFGGGIKIGSDDMDGLIIDDRSTGNLQRVGQMLLNRAAHWMPHLSDVNAEDCNLAIGVRPYPDDGLPIIGEVPHSNGLYVLATHSGITLAPIIGAYMSDLLSGQTPAFDATPYSLARFPGFA